LVRVLAGQIAGDARVETHIVQPSSVLVDRRARRAKSDGIDAELLLRTLLAWLRGEPRVCSMVPIPAEGDEDARRSIRERTELVAERVALVNRIGAVLATMGCRALLQVCGGQAERVKPGHGETATERPSEAGPTL
jgi:transposase